MYVHEIVIDGFKSYATRTVVSGFDAQFNAITGLNGSGKSNILDAICFVLGISNLSQVRAHSLQELVYKQGQAGVTKASVTIVFNNEDKSCSPIGYEDHDQIVVTRQVAIGGRNKYLINGVAAQQNRVQTFFQSVQLNINNPTFLIMQGRITKVINMKPLELLAMIEETAGTKMYQSKKEAALKTIEKKQAKVDEINRMLSEEINPSLEKLRKEKAQYLQWSTINAECEKLLRFVTAYEYYRAQEIVNEAEKDGAEMQEQFDTLGVKIKESQKILGEKSEKLQQLKRKKEVEESRELKELDAKITDLSKQLVKLSTTWEHKKSSYKADVDARNKLNGLIKELEETIAKKKEELKAAKNSAVEAVQEEKNAKDQIEALQQILLSGATMDSSHSEKSLADKLMDVKRKATEADTEIQAAKVRKTHFEAELKQKSAAVKAASAELAKQNAQRIALTKEVEAAKAQLNKIKYKPEDRDALHKQIQTETVALRSLRERVDNLSASLASLDFQFADPEPGFDRSKVKGLVAQLVHVKQADTATALEVAAGSKLYQVVVDSDKTGKSLLSGGKLKKRVTIIPLNRIDTTTVSKPTVDAAAKALGKDRAKLALSLVGYDEEVDAAMKYVFGRTFVCTDDEAAKTVAFDKSIRCRAVTLSGDVFDPQGTLTGGSRPDKGASILAKLQQLAECREELEQREDNLKKMQHKLTEMDGLSQTLGAASREVELKTHELELLEDRLKQTTQHRLVEDVAELEKGIAECDRIVTEGAQVKAKSEEEAARLQKEISGTGNSKEKQAKENEKKLAAAKDRLASVTRASKNAQAQLEALEAEIKTAQEELGTSKEQLQQANVALTRSEKDVHEAEAATAQVKGEYDAAQREADERRSILKETDKEMSALNKEIHAIEHQINESKLETKRLEHKIGNHKKTVKEAEKTVEVMLKKNPWIDSEKQFFNRPKSDYDFSARDPKKAQDRFATLQEEQTKLGKKINKKVMSLFDKAESEYQELVRKKRIIEADKEKIEKVIDELDEKKNQALKTTWNKVNRDFGSIFSTLLPGAKAKLEPQEGTTVLEGLEFKVGFGDCWKESLSELSGGQRSLLALSLILALLLFKPAPMYILDEIDAALDLSHTQNIGIMLRTHFTKSQFIIVSLKEGMFNNANVLFRTKFVDGVSTVARTTPGVRAR